MQAERRQITVVFAQFAGVAERSLEPDPEDLGEVLNTARKLAVGEFESLGGFVAQDAGDGVLAYFGYPHSQENDPERAVRAALGVAARVRSVAPLDGVRAQARIGVATDLVVVGGQSTTGKVQDDVGAPLDFVLRLPALPRAGGILIDEGTRHHIGDLFECREQQTASLDDGAEPMRLWEVHGEGRIADRFRALRSGGVAFVGREEEVDLLARRWAGAKAGEGRVVLISGEPGIGKSRLTAVLRERAAADKHVCLEYFCAPHMSESMLFPVLRQLEIAAGFEASDTVDAKLQKLEALLAMSSQDVRGDSALIADFLAIPTGDRYPKRDSSPQKRKELLLRRLLAQLEGLARAQPVLILFEDAHWADPTSREQLDLTIRRIEEMPVLLVITHRPTFAPPWLGLPQVSAITLSRLSKRDNATMLGRLTGGRRLPKELTDQIIARTDGVPLFVEELTKSILESGILREDGDAYVLTDALPALAVPTSLQASLVSRLDRLASVRHVAQIGAALGREFSYEMIAAVSEMPDAELRAALDRLIDAELLHQRGEPPDAVYTFKHALVQDAAHGTMLRGQRSSVHARITGVLERSFPETAARRPDLLAHHATESGLWEKAIGYRLAAALQSLTRSAAAETHGHIDKVKALLQHLDEGAVRHSLDYQQQFIQAHAFMISKGWTAPEVGAILSELRGHPGRRPDSDEDFSINILSWTYHFFRSELPQIRSLVDVVLKSNSRDRDRSAVCRWSRGLAQLGMGRFAEAILDIDYFLHNFSDAFSIRTIVLTGPNIEDIAQVWRGMAYLVLGYPDQARQSVERGISMPGQKPSTPMSMSTLFTSAMFVFALLGDVDRVAALVGKLVPIAAEERLVFATTRCEQQLGWVEVMRGRTAEGVDRLARATAFLRTIGVAAFAPYFLVTLAACRLRAGDVTGADATITETLASIQSTEERCFEAEAWRVRGDIDLAASPNDTTTAEASYRRALEVGTAQGAALWQLRAATGLARLLSSRGAHAEARAVLAPIHASITEGFDIPDMVAARDVLERAARRST